MFYTLWRAIQTLMQKTSHLLFAGIALGCITINTDTREMVWIYSSLLLDGIKLAMKPQLAAAFPIKLMG